MTYPTPLSSALTETQVERALERLASYDAMMDAHIVWRATPRPATSEYDADEMRDARVSADKADRAIVSRSLFRTLANIRSRP